MDKEQKKRMANRTIVQEGDQDIEFTVQVSGDQVELSRTYDQPWDNEGGTGPDVSHEVWTMSLDTFKRFMTAAQWCVEKSLAFETAHPLEVRQNDKDLEYWHTSPNEDAREWREESGIYEKTDTAL